VTGVLVDTSVWVDHFRQRNDGLMHLLERDLALTHPLIVGEIACGTPPQRAQTLTDLSSLQQTPQAGIREVMDFIERERLFGLGCGLVDLLLLCSTLLTPAAQLWTLDKRLSALAQRFGVVHARLTPPPPHNWW
jgi:predicted nucleic acid-binding protein